MGITGGVGATVLVVGVAEVQQGIAVGPKRDGVDHSHTEQRETHAFEEAEDLQGRSREGNSQRWVAAQMSLPCMRLQNQNPA